MAIHWHNRISVRLSLSIVTVIVVTALAIATLILRDEKRILQEDLRLRALQLGEIMPRQIIEPLLYDEFYNLHRLIKSYLDSKDSFLVYGEIYDDQQKLLLSREREPGLKEPIGAIPSHFEKPIFLRDFPHVTSKYPLDLLIPITSKKLGVAGYLRLGISVEPLLQTLRTSQKKVWAATGFIAFVGILTGLWMARQLIYPVLLLNRGAYRVGKGDLGTEIPETGVGEIRELAITFNTMSGRLKELVAAITSAQENLVRTEKLYALGEFSAGLAHEIKNPLTSMKMLIQRAEEQEEALEGRDLEVLTEELDRIDYTVSQFLRSARQSEISRTETDINSLVENVLAFTRPKIEKSGIRIEKKLSPTLPSIQVDRGSIRQILINGILNSLQAMPEEGILSITTDVEENYLKCIISDTGTGIPEKNLKHIFDPFFTTKEDGTGMGLAVAWNIAQQHGGKLDIVSSENDGTSLNLLLPL